MRRARLKVMIRSLWRKEEDAEDDEDERHSHEFGSRPELGHEYRLAALVTPENQIPGCETRLISFHFKSVSHSRLVFFISRCP